MRFTRTIIGAAMVLSLVLAAAPARAQFGFLESGLEERLERALSAPGRDIDLIGLEITGRLDFSVERIVLSDEQGVWLEILGADVDWQPSRLLRGALVVERLEARRILFQRLPQPVAGEAPPDDQEQPGFALPSLPIPLEIQAFRAPIRLGAPVLGEAVLVNAAGELALSRTSLDVQFQGSTATDPATNARLSLIYRETGEPQFDIAFHMDEPPGGFAAHLAGLPGQEFSLDLDGQGPPDNWQGEVDLALGGVTCLESGVVIDVTAPLARLDGRAASSCITPELEQIAETFAVKAVVKPSTEGLVDIEDGAIATKTSRVAVSGQLYDDRMDLALALASTDLGEFSALAGTDLSGSLQARASLSGPYANPALAVTDLVSDGGALAGLAWDRLSGDIAIDDLAAPRWQVAGEGRIVQPRTDTDPLVAAADWAVRGVVTFEGGVVEIARARLATDLGNVTAQGVLRRWGEAAELDYTLTLPQLAPILEQAKGGIEASGQISGNLIAPEIAVTASGQTQSLSTGIAALDELMGERPDFSARLVYDADGLRLDSGVVEGALARLAAEGQVLDRPDLEWRLAISDLAPLGVDPAGDMTAQGRLVGPWDDLRLPLTATAQAGEFTAETEATLLLGGDDPVIQLAALDVRGLDLTLSLIQPVTVVAAERGLVIGDGTLALDGAAIALDDVVVGEDLQGVVTVSGLPVELLQAFAPDLPPTGTVDLRAVLAGSLDDPDIRFDIAGRRIGAGPTTLDFDLAGALRDGRLDVQANAQAGEALQARIDAAMPFRVDGDILPPDAPLDIALQADGDLALLSDLMPALQGSRMDGRLVADLSVGGTLGDPAINGVARVAQGAYENFDTGTIIRDLSLVANAQGAGLIVIEGSGTDGAGGAIAVSGRAEWTEAGPVYDIVANLDRFRAVRLDLLEAQTSGQVQLAGGPDEALISGQLRVREAEFSMASVLQAQRVVILDVVEINKPGAPPMPTEQPAPEETAKETAEETAETGFGPVVALDMDIVIDRVFVRGEGLDSIWAGQLYVIGTLDAPRITGSLGVERGQYVFVGRTLFLSSESRVTFQGRDEIDPLLNVIAEAEAEGVTAQVRVFGEASQPRFDFTSVPPLPSDQVLARLMFGEEAGQLSTFQQLQLAQAAAGLFDGGTGFDPIGGVRGALGLDTLEIGTGAEEAGADDEADFAPTIAAGKYLDRDTFVQLEGGPAGGAISVERQLGGGFSVETELGRQGGGGLGVNWRKDY